MTIAFKSAIELAAMIRDKQISSRELTQYFIDRIEKYDSEINAVVVKDYDRALASADEADRTLANGDAIGPLHGLPMTIKEAYNIAGLPTHWGIPELKDNIATADADTVVKLKAAGAHFIGKTNVPINLGDFQSYNAINGTTSNPWDIERIPGGSSGGSAAALAAGFTGLEAGSDIGGSIRNPAHFCGVYGHKPTYGVVPWQGHELPGMSKAADIAVVGPLARSAEDLRVSMEIVTGPEPLDAPGWQLNLPRPVKTKLSDFKVAIWCNSEISPVSQEISDRALSIGETLALLGATVSDSARPQIDFSDSNVIYLTMLRAVMSASLPEEVLSQAQALAAQFSSSDMSDEAVLARAAVQPHRQWLQTANRRELLRAAWCAFFNEWDILICPQTATTAFKHDHSALESRTLMVDNNEAPYFQQLFWAGFVGIANLPSTVFPTGLSHEGLPIGLQAVGAEFNDYICIDFARLMAEEIGGFQPPPGFDD